MSNMNKPLLERGNTIFTCVNTTLQSKKETTNPFQGLSLQLPSTSKKEEAETPYYSNNTSKDIQTLLELSNFTNNNRILSIGLKVYHSGWEEEDCHDKYYMYQKVRSNELSSENLRKIQELDRFNRSKKSNFDYKEFDDSFLNKYTLISCWKENYENCQYQLFQRYYDCRY